MDRFKHDMGLSKHDMKHDMDATEYDFAEASPVDFAPRSDAGPTVFESYKAHSSGQRIFTDSVVASAIREKHPELTLTITNGLSCNLLQYAQLGFASAVPFGDSDEMLFTRLYVPAAYRSGTGKFAEQIQFACFKYEFSGLHFLLYVVDTRDGVMSYPAVPMNYILSGKRDGDAKGVDNLIKAVTQWAAENHDEIWVFDQGRFIKDAELWKAIEKASWEDVILEKEKKEAVIDDVTTFFDGKKSYEEFGVPWKRGLIFYGPPGNGKTVSIKALMNDLTRRDNPSVEILYVKTLTSFMGPEGSVRAIFTKARQLAPCMLIFEDLDSTITDNVRSYFLNEVDGLESNDGILMIGSTNHMERLDPGISKRPSRFDRKYLFDLPTRDERVQYSEYWREKLKNNEKIDFPTELSGLIADITKDFSFAYMKEAFVASLLHLVAKQKKDEVLMVMDDGGKQRAEKSLLWKEIQKQVKNLRDEMDSESKGEVKKSSVLGIPTASQLPLRSVHDRRTTADRATTFGAFGQMKRDP